MIAALLFYFLSGYLIVSMAFLTIGSVSNSMQDAQAFLMPVMIALMLPVVLMMNAVLLNPGGPIPRVLSWIPVYTPFAMLARLNGGVSVAEFAGTGVLLAAFIVLEFLMLGRVFRASVLNAGQPPKLAGLFRLMVQRPAA
jgi:ABC-2 type transport system permease protein